VGNPELRHQVRVLTPEGSAFESKSRQWKKLEDVALGLQIRLARPTFFRELSGDPYPIPSRRPGRAFDPIKQ
jgi:hypothetical protein